MRLRILTQYYLPEVGAPQIRLHAIARELYRQGIEVDVVTGMPNYPTGRVFRGYRRRLALTESLDGVDIRRNWLFVATGRGATRLLNYLSFAAASLPRVIAAPRPDVIVVESPPLFLGVTAWLASRWLRVPYVMIISDLWPASVAALGVVRSRLVLVAAERLELFLYRRAVRVIGVTDGIADSIRARIGGATPVVMVPNGVDTALFRNVSACPPWADGRTAFVFAGTHGYAQGLDVILDAADRLRHRCDLVFWMVGDGPDKERLVARAAELGLENIQFIDAQSVSAMPCIFSAAAASIVPLRRGELFKGARPSKILPSLACETPVIFCGEGEAAALLAEADCGLSVPPEDPAALAIAVERLADDPDMRKRLGRHGRLMAEQRFSWQTIAANLASSIGATPA